MIKINLPGKDPVDWQDWDTPLAQFAEASGLVASAFDVTGARRVGPKTGSRLAALLAGSTLWDEDGPGTALERGLVRATIDGGAPAVTQLDGLRVQSQPLVLHGEVYGALVFGWRFADFSSPLECERIARQIGLPGHLLWSEARLDAPVSARRMATYASLLATLSNTLDRQREAIGELTRVSRTREVFLATVSHEMRTPLSALKMRIELMLRTMPELPAKAVVALEAMRLHVRQETAMVDDLIDASRTLTGQMSVTRAPVMLGQVLRDAISTVEPLVHARRIALLVTPSDHGDRLRLLADGRRLQQVFWNLLSNAAKFTPESGTIRVGVTHRDGAVAVAVSDSGQGIEAADLAHVFGAFNLQQTDNASGLGLGLYIAQRIVELHAGTLSVDSGGRGAGATFTVILPLADDPD